VRAIKNWFCALLPKTMAICKQYRKCGKARCRCSRGALHGPYYYRFYRVDGRLKKSYIRKADAKALWDAYSRRRKIQRQRVADRKDFASICRDLRRFDRMVIQMLFWKGTEGSNEHAISQR